MKLRDVVIFLAGAEFFHTLHHILLPCFVSLPIELGFMTMTPTLNLWAIIVNGLITVLLLWWAARLSKP